MLKDVTKKQITIRDIPRVLETVGITTPLIVGDSGIGKTQAIRENINHNTTELIEIDASTMNPEDAYIPKSKDGVLRFIVNEIFKQPEDGRQKLIFVDEINRGNTAVRRALMSMINEKRVGAVDLSHIHWIAACNPDTEDYPDTEEISDKAFIRRFSWYELRFDIEQFISYMVGKEYDKRVLNFIIEAHTKFGDLCLGNKNCPRQWERLCKLGKDSIKDLKWFAESCLDQATVVQLGMALDKEIKFLKLSEILNNPDIEAPNRPLEILLLKNEFVDLKKWNKQNVDNLVNFIKKLKNSICYQFLKDIQETNNKLFTQMLERQEIIDRI